MNMEQFGNVTTTDILLALIRCVCINVRSEVVSERQRQGNQDRKKSTRVLRIVRNARLTIFIKM